ncbi:8-oxo-dGDP phosphatase NUDT18 [Balaenoptera acutorostrata]|uniref:8-oxo-dGDP phosphatase NUDT18 n=1 Tax=Balaenoptera acutorostrata TaxID=9767 RepID=A0ABM3TP05_BALAC|nr:8-oxo-dGDP phosphatase NUDT18 [Balaenoptera acutorostrata]
MASEDLAGALAAVLGGRGLRVQSYDSGPAGETPAQVRLRKNVCYVVLAVFLNEQDEVLLIQEAKKECRGSWYLPAGRMEPRETIVEALQREVKEEAGLQCEPLTLLSVEERGPSWIRFVFLARPTEQRGGIKMAVLRLLQECLTLHHLAVETKGLLGLQHLGKDQTDGICLNVLVTVAFRNPGIQNEPPKVRGENFFWWKVVEEDLQSQLLQRLQESSVVPINR